MKRLLLLLLLLGLSGLSGAAIETYKFDDLEKEKRYKNLIDELRCLVCQNQNLADSNAELAQDLRRKTYEMVNQGLTENEVADYMVQRYGDFVLYRPPLKANTLVLWIGPFVILLIGLAVMLRIIRRHPTSESGQLSDEDRRRAEKMLQQHNEEK